MSVFTLRLHTTLAASALIGAFALPASATTSVSGTLNVVANSLLAKNTVTDLHTDSWVAVPTTLTESAFAKATAGNDSVTTSGSAVATWTSVDSGSVQFDRYGWQFHVADPANAPDASDLVANRGGDDWTYTFTATQNGQINLNYNVSVASGDPFGLWGWSIDWSGPGGGLPVTNPFDPTASGTFTRAVVAGQTYTIGLNGNPNVSFQGAPGDYSGFMDGQFDFTIVGSGVPEPGAWSLMIVGLGLAGGALRRRRALAAS